MVSDRQRYRRYTGKVGVAAEVQERIIKSYLRCYDYKGAQRKDGQIQPENDISVLIKYFMFDSKYIIVPIEN